jgi:hypothetical protein
MRVKVNTKIAIYSLSINLLQDVEYLQNNNIKKLAIYYKFS